MAFDSASSPLIIVEKELDLPGPRVVYANKAFETMTGYSFEEIKEKTPRVLQGKDSNRTISRDLRTKLQNGFEYSFETINYKKDGSAYNVIIKIFPIKDSNGNVTHYGSIQEDITEKIERIDYLQRFIDLQDNIVILTDGHKIHFANQRLLDFFGYRDLDEFKEYHDDISQRFIEDQRFFSLAKVQEGRNWLDQIKSMPHSQRIVSMLRYDFNIHAFSVTVNSFNLKTDIVTLTNISQTILNQIKLHEKNIHDKLTNSFNREYFEQNYQSLIDQYRDEGYNFALAILDIDHFKSVNDTYGHDVGDDVLKKFVAIIKKYSRKEDVLIRWGGEEFVMILKVASLEGLEKALNHIRKVVQFEDFSNVGKVTCSIGATLYEDHEDIEITIKRADENLYIAKRTGRNKVIATSL
ncbi:MAG: diguanylate cyclase [Campylobacterales bacterium]|nr:diguanylate cyclase [Campylobacterales bacterium]